MKGDNLGRFLGDELTEGFNVGGGSNPSAPSIHPDISMLPGSSGDAAAGSGAAESYAGMSETAGAISGVSLATGLPEAYAEAGLGETLIGGLGDPPRA